MLRMPNYQAYVKTKERICIPSGIHILTNIRRINMSNKKSQKVENISTRKATRNELIEKIYNLVLEG